MIAKRRSRPFSPVLCLDALATYKWIENQCLAADRNGEMDWMNFMYFLHTRGGANSFTFPDMKEVFEATPGTTWTQLLSTTESIHGAGSAKVEHLLTAADTRGVDH